MHSPHITLHLRPDVFRRKVEVIVQIEAAEACTVLGIHAVAHSQVPGMPDERPRRLGSAESEELIPIPAGQPRRQKLEVPLRLPLSGMSKPTRAPFTDPAFRQSIEAIQMAGFDYELTVEVRFQECSPVLLTEAFDPFGLLPPHP